MTSAARERLIVELEQARQETADAEVKAHVEVGALRARVVDERKHRDNAIANCLSLRDERDALRARLGRAERSAKGSAR